MHLYLIRHGEKGNDFDGALTPHGQAQARALAGWMTRELPVIDVLYSSTMRRARETAQVLAQTYRKEIIFEDRVREYGCNYADHRPIPSDQFGAPYSLAEKSTYELTLLPVLGIPGSESWADFRGRVNLFIQDILRNHYNPYLRREEARRIAVVCHGGVISAVFDYVFNIDVMHRPCELWQENTAITYFERRNDPWYEPWRLHYHARAEHLRGW